MVDMNAGTETDSVELEVGVVARLKIVMSPGRRLHAASAAAAAPILRKSRRVIATDMQCCFELMPYRVGAGCKCDMNLMSNPCKTCSS